MRFRAMVLDVLNSEGLVLDSDWNLVVYPDRFSSREQTLNYCNKIFSCLGVKDKKTLHETIDKWHQRIEKKRRADESAAVN